MRRQGSEATFTTPQNSVSIDAEAVSSLESLGPTPSGPFLEAFDASGNDLGEADYPFRDIVIPGVQPGAPDCHVRDQQNRLRAVLCAVHHE